MGAVGEPRVDRAARVNPGLCCGSPSGNKRRSHGTRKVTRPRGTSASQPAKLQRGEPTCRVTRPAGPPRPNPQSYNEGANPQNYTSPGAQTSQPAKLQRRGQRAELHVTPGRRRPAGPPRPNPQSYNEGSTCRVTRPPGRRRTAGPPRPNPQSYNEGSQPAELHVPRGADVPRDLRVPTRKVTRWGQRAGGTVAPCHPSPPLQFGGNWFGSGEARPQGRGVTRRGRVCRRPRAPRTQPNTGSKDAGAGFGSIAAQFRDLGAGELCLDIAQSLFNVGLPFLQILIGRLIEIGHQAVIQRGHIAPLDRLELAGLH